MKKLFICLIILISFISSTTVAYAEGLNKDDNHSSIIDEMIDKIETLLAYCIVFLIVAGLPLFLLLHAVCTVCP